MNEGYVRLCWKSHWPGATKQGKWVDEPVTTIDMGEEPMSNHQPLVSDEELRDCLASPDKPHEMDFDDLCEAVEWGSQVAKDLQDALTDLDKLTDMISGINSLSKSGELRQSSSRIRKKHGWVNE